MTYRKPEVSVLGDAASVIQNYTVKDPSAMNPDAQAPFWPLQPAYDLDE